jgi:hypothetical protein
MSSQIDGLEMRPIFHAQDRLDECDWVAGANAIYLTVPLGALGEDYTM